MVLIVSCNYQVYVSIRRISCSLMIILSFRESSVTSWSRKRLEIVKILAQNNNLLNLFYSCKILKLSFWIQILLVSHLVYTSAIFCELYFFFSFICGIRIENWKIQSLGRLPSFSVWNWVWKAKNQQWKRLFAPPFLWFSPGDCNELVSSFPNCFVYPNFNSVSWAGDILEILLV